jgi:SAM-dependent methyltransferase
VTLPADFAAVDAGETAELVAMIDATDAWPAVRAARAWVLEQAGLGTGAVLIDAGCGPGTFGAADSTVAVGVDRSRAMLGVARTRHPTTRPVLADVGYLPIRTGAAPLVHVERVLQWVADPEGAVVELQRITAPGGWTAVTDTDWSTFAVDHPLVGARDRFRAAALGWVPHPRFAADAAATLASLGARDVRTRTDTVSVTAWDPDDPAQRDGPPGLPLRSIATGAPAADRDVIEHDLDLLAAAARQGSFRASVDILTAAARR